MIKKLTGIILFALFSLRVYAHPTITQIINTNVTATVNITVKPGTISSTSINPSTGAFLSLLNPGFIVVSNQEIKMQMYSTLQNSLGQDVYGMFTSGGINYMLFGNIGNLSSSSRPSQSAIDNAKSASPTASLNANVIAYTMIPSIDNTGVVQFTTNHYDLNVKKNTTNITLNVGTAARNQTFSSHDMAGDYKSILRIDYLP